MWTKFFLRKYIHVEERLLSIQAILVINFFCKYNFFTSSLLNFVMPA